MFHSQDSLYFERLNAGNVRIVKTDGPPPGEGKSIFEAIVPDGIWGSAVLSMTAFGERPGDWHRFMDHHNGRVDFCTAPNALDSIIRLRSNEGASVEILCDNPNGTGPDNAAIEVTDDWTAWEPKRFYGPNIPAALTAAEVAKQHADAVASNAQHAEEIEALKSFIYVLDEPEEYSKPTVVCEGRPGCEHQMELVVVGDHGGGDEMQCQRCPRRIRFSNAMCRHEYEFISEGSGSDNYKCRLCNREMSVGGEWFKGQPGRMTPMKRT